MSGNPILVTAVFAITFTFAIAGTMVQAQQPVKVPTIGYLSATHRDVHAPRFQAFRDGLRELGYAEGRNITIADRFAAGKSEQLREFVAEFIRLKVDVIVAGGSQAGAPAAKSTKTIPIVVVHFEDPVREGFVSSLARPGGNVTGLSRMSGDLEGKRVELLKETVHKAHLVAFLLDPTNATDVLLFREAGNTARTLGIQLQRLKVRSTDDLDAALGIVKKDRAHALIPSANPFLNAQSKRIIDFAARNRLPTMYTVKVTWRPGV